MPRPQRTHTTVLLACEGYAEAQLAVVIRDLYLPRGCGVVLTWKNRRGYGGAAALQLAIEFQRGGAFDHYGVLVDTDREWSTKEQQTAAARGIVAVECHPSIEGFLLGIDSKRVSQRTADNKAAFRIAYGDDAHRPGVIKRHFDRNKFDLARPRVPALNRLLTLIRC